jgi:hypothetical protein
LLETAGKLLRGVLPDGTSPDGVEPSPLLPELLQAKTEPIVVAIPVAINIFLNFIVTSMVITFSGYCENCAVTNFFRKVCLGGNDLYSVKLLMINVLNNEKSFYNLDQHLKKLC